jgi:hypothetical protein
MQAIINNVTDGKKGLRVYDHDATPNTMGDTVKLWYTRW